MKKLLATSVLLGSATVLAVPFVVQNIEVSGIQSHLQPKFLAALPVKVGHRVTDSDVSRLVQMLYVNGYDAPSVQRSGNTLQISVQPQLTINEVTFTGNAAIPDAGLKENLKSSGISKGDIFNRQKMNTFSREMENYLRSVGRYNAKVKAEYTKQPNDRIDIKLIIEEGEKAVLESLTFKGNKAFSDGTLGDQIDLAPTAWWKLFGGKFEEAQFGKDLEALQAFYLNNGYPKMRITETDLQFSDDKNSVNVVIGVDEGILYNVSQVRIVGDLGGIAPAKFDNALKEVKLGEFFRRSDLDKAEEEIKTVLGNQGYGNPKIQLSPEFNDENGTMVVTFVVDAGRRYIVREIRFEGNTTSSDSTLRQEMRQQEGTWLSSQLVQLGKVRLDRTGFFESVETETLTVPGTDDQIDVVYKIRERNTGSINFGIGYGTESGFSYNVGVEQQNFLGMGSAIALKGEKNDYGKNISLSYTEPYFTKDGVSLGGSIFYDDYDNSKNDNASSYSKKSYGLNGTLSFPVNEHNAYYIGLGVVKNKLDNISPEYSRWLYKESMGYKDWTFSAVDYTVSFGWNYNSLDRGYFPTEGVKASLGGRALLPFSDNKYYTIDATVQGYYPLDRDHRWVLSGKLSANFADGFGGKRLPFYQNYSAGGIGSLRGFAYGGVGPNAIYAASQSCNINSNPKGGYNYCVLDSDVVGGNAMALASIELVVPTPFVADKNQTNIRTSFFADAASVWDTHWHKDGKNIYTALPDYGDPTRIRASVGVGFQWYSPIGLLAFSYAKPIKKYDNDDIEQFQFTVGSSF